MKIVLEKKFDNENFTVLNNVFYLRYHNNTFVTASTTLVIMFLNTFVIYKVRIENTDKIPGPTFLPN